MSIEKARERTRRHSAKQISLRRCRKSAEEAAQEHTHRLLRSALRELKTRVRRGIEASEADYVNPLTDEHKRMCTYCLKGLYCADIMNVQARSRKEYRLAVRAGILDAIKPALEDEL